MPTIYDIAARAGVSISTVSRAFRHPELVGEETYRHILSVADDMGYRPNRLARVLAEGRSQSIGLLLPWIGDNPFFLEVMQEFERMVRLSGYEPVVASWQDAHIDSVLHEVHGLQDRMVDGLLLYVPPQFAQEFVSAGSKPSVPTVLLGSYPSHGAYEVGPDEVAAGRIATQHLLSLGHRHIAFVCPWPQPDTWRREQGYVDALKEAGGIPCFVEGEMTAAGGQAAIPWLLSNYPDATAVIAANDMTAFGACRGLTDAGVRVPDDMSVVGFDNLPITEFMVPRLTTVDLMARETAVLGVRRLLGLITGCDAGPGTICQALLMPQLVERQSTLPVSRAPRIVRGGGDGPTDGAGVCSGTLVEGGDRVTPSSD